MAEQPVTGQPEPPPPRATLLFAGFALAFELATVIVLIADRNDLGTILAVLALVFGAATFFTLLSRGSGGATYSSTLAKEDKIGPAPNDPTRR